jgi:hypothetical protein
MHRNYHSYQIYGCTLSVELVISVSRIFSVIHPVRAVIMPDRWPMFPAVPAIMIPPNTPG